MHRKPIENPPVVRAKLVLPYEYVIEIVNILWLLHEEKEKADNLRPIFERAKTLPHESLVEMLEAAELPLSEPLNLRLHENMYSTFLNLLESMEYEN